MAVKMNEISFEVFILIIWLFKTFYTIKIAVYYHTFMTNAEKFLKNLQRFCNKLYFFI